MNTEKKRRIIIVFIILTILFIVAVLINIVSGSVSFSLKDIWDICIGERTPNTLEYNVLFKIRFPRIFAAVLFGIALSISGFLLQTFFRNPIAGPYVLGISSGARLFVGFIILTNFTFNINFNSLFLIFFASAIGSILSMILVLTFAKRVRDISILIVVGIMIGYIASAGTNFMIAFASDYKITNLTMWSMGSFSGITWKMIKISSIIIIPAVIGVFCLSKPLQAYLLGENYAKSMGVNVKNFRLILIFLSSILSACVTGFAGPISFVGIAVPHLTRLTISTSQPKILVPAVTLMGASFCLLSDYLARTLFAPTELSLSTITSIIGAPIVIWLMVCKNKKYGTI